MPMNTRRAFLAEVGAALSGLLLPGISEACWLRRCRSSCSCCSGECPHAHKAVEAATCRGGCLSSLAGQWNGLYPYICRCFPSCNPFIDVVFSKLFSLLPGPFDGPSGNFISFPAAFEYLGPATGFYAS